MAWDFLRGVYKNHSNSKFEDIIFAKQNDQPLDEDYQCRPLACGLCPEVRYQLNKFQTYGFILHFRGPASKKGWFR